MDPKDIKDNFKDDEIQKLVDDALNKSKNISTEKESGNEIENNLQKTIDEVSKGAVFENKIKNIRTYQGDVAEAIKKQKESLLSMQMAEKERSSKNVKIKDKGILNKFILLVSLLLIIGGGIGLYFFYKKTTSVPITVPVVRPENQLILSDTEIKIPVSEVKNRDGLIKIITDQINKTDNKKDSVIQLNLTKNSLVSPLTTDEFLALSRIALDGNLYRSFDPVFMLGIYSNNQNYPFVIIKINSFENAFSGMLSWEKNIVTDIGPLFVSKDNLVGTDGKEWKDITIKNKDARILTNQYNKTILIYSFLDNQTLLISTDEDALTYILNRYISSKLIR